MATVFTQGIFEVLPKFSSASARPVFGMACARTEFPSRSRSSAYTHEVKGLRFTLPASLPVRFREPSKLNKPGFVGVWSNPNLASRSFRLSESSQLPTVLKADYKGPHSENDHAVFPFPFRHC